MKEIIVLAFTIFAFIGSYCMVTFFMGGVTAGIIYPKDAPIDHKWTMFISGNIWFFSILFLIIFLC